MATKMKGIYKGIKYISHLFVVKEREIEIGFPMDVKHVAHIGLDGSDDSAPSWMNDFKPAPDSGLSSVGSSKHSSKAGSMMSGCSSRDPTWTSQDFDQSLGRQQAPGDIFVNNFPPTNLPNTPKKPKRKKGTTSSSSSKKSSSSPKSINSSPKSTSSRYSRTSRKSILGKDADNADM